MSGGFGPGLFRGCEEHGMLLSCFPCASVSPCAQRVFEAVPCVSEECGASGAGRDP